MAPDEICGLLVVRLPPLNRDADARGAYRDVAPCAGERCYGGIGRMPWFDVDEDAILGRLPPDVQRMWEALEADNTDISGISLSRDAAAARAMLAHANARGIANELIAVRSDLLAEVKGVMPARGMDLEWTGYDVFSLGGWSLLENLFWAPAAFPGWMETLNGDGLLPDAGRAHAFIDAYRAAERAGQVEEIPEEVLGTAIIEVARVRVRGLR